MMDQDDYLMPRKFRRDFVEEVEAVPWDGSELSTDRVLAWGQGAITYWTDGEIEIMSFITGDEKMPIFINDWIVRDAQNELRACTPQVFKREYRPVPDDRFDIVLGL